MSRWYVRFAPAELPSPTKPLPFVAELSGDWEGWLRQAEVVAGTPFLLSPSLEYDVVLNSFFQGRAWREAAEADHRAYLYSRRRDPADPRVSGAAWDREVAAVNRFYRWALRHGHVQVNPIPQTSISAVRCRRPRAAGPPRRRGLARRRHHRQ
jgi:hypothetical protein